MNTSDEELTAESRNEKAEAEHDQTVKLLRETEETLKELQNNISSTRKRLRLATQKYEERISAPRPS